MTGTGQRQHQGHKFSEGLLNQEAIIEGLNIRPGQTIADAGCGNGYMSKAFSAKLENKGRVYALDSDKIQLARLKEQIEGTLIEPLKADITESIPLASSSVDLVYLATVFHIFGRTRAGEFDREVRRVLKPGGILAVVEIDKRETPFGPPLGRRFSPEELKQRLTLTPGELLRAGEYFYLQMFRND